MTAAVLIQARLGSTRFPAKVLADLRGRPVIRWVVERATQIGLSTILACPRDDVPALQAACGEQPRLRIVGSDRPEGDVLGRLVDAARPLQPDLILRVTADCPFLDPALGRTLALAWSARQRFSGAPDYLAPCYPPPECADGGLDIEAVSGAALATAEREATDPLDREHPTRFLWRQPDRFVCLKHNDPKGYGQRGIRWMVDTPEDLTRLTTIARHLAPWHTGWRDTLAADRQSRGVDIVSLPG